MTDIEIRRPVPLRTVHGVELAAVGTWKASTGETTFTTEDFAAAVAALECPGVRNPVLKLGHTEEDSDSGVRWDGEPAVGWIANMRFDGAKIIGDYTGVPSWLADADENGLSVLAAAYPDRSIEIYRPFLCQIGHNHPAVITAVALLGVAAPGVGVLKSMQDVYAAFTEPTAKLSTLVKLAADDGPREPTDIERQSQVDFSKVREQHEEALVALLAAWPDVEKDQRAELAAQIEQAVDADPDRLGAISVSSAAAASLLLSSMRSVADRSARDQVAEAKKQGAEVPLPTITDDDVRDVAEAVTGAMASSTAGVASRTAAQSLGTGDGKHIATTVIEHLDGLSDRFLRDELGGALSTAQARGRYAALYGYSGPVDLYASEINDVRACSPCRSIDGMHFDSLDQAQSQYGAGKYSGCSGGSRCRGQLIAVFGSAASAPLSTTVRMTLGGTMPPDGAVRASVSVEDVSRRYYESAGYSMFITAMHVDPLELIAADDSSGKFFRVPVELKGDEFTFGEPQEVAVAYQDVKSAAAALPVRFADRKASLAAAGKNEDGTDRVASDVSPAGQAIRKAAEKPAAATAVLETEVVATSETPDADTATGPTTTPKEASMDAAKMREALGLGPDASDEEVTKAFSAQVSASAPVTPPQADIEAMATLAGSGQAVLIDKAQLSTLIETARKGEIAYNQNRKNERNDFLSAAVREGRIPPASLTAYERLWDQDPEGTRKTVSLLARNIIPVSASGFLGQEVDENEADNAYTAMYGKVA